MSHEIYLNIHCAAPSEIPAAFADYAALAAFTENHPSRLCVGSMGEDLYEKLEHAVAEHELEPLSWLDAKASTEEVTDSEIGAIRIKRLDHSAAAEIAKAIDTLIAKAVDEPESLIVVRTQFDEDEAVEIAQAAAEPPLDMEVDDLSYYDLGESWDHFFYFLYLMREICREAGAAGKGMALTWADA